MWSNNEHVFKRKSWALWILSLWGRGRPPLPHGVVIGRIVFSPSLNGLCKLLTSDDKIWSSLQLFKGGITVTRLDNAIHRINRYPVDKRYLARSFHFENHAYDFRQIELHSVQLPLFIGIRLWVWVWVRVWVNSVKAYNSFYNASTGSHCIT